MTMQKNAIAALAALGLSLGAGAAVAKELKASAHLTPANNTISDGWQPFIEMVRERTDGELEIKLFLGGSLLGPKAVSSGIRDGVVDMGYVVTGYFPAEFPYTAFIGDMAGIGSNPAVVSAATTELTFLHCEPCLAEYRAQGNVYTGSGAVPPLVLMSRDMLDDPEAIRGKKIRSPGGIWDRFTEHLGAVPVNVPSSEQYEAMSRKVVDVTLHVPSSMKTNDLWDMVEDVVLVNVGTYRAINTFAFNPDSWAALSDGERRVILETAADANIGVAAGYGQAGDEALKTSEEKGIRVREMTPAWQQTVDEFVAAEKAGLVEIGTEKRGVENPEIYIKKMSELVDKWQAIYDELDGDVEAFKARLKEEVIAKVDASTYGL